MHIVLLGPPGAGKGTQAKHLAEWRGIPHVSSGDLFRSAVGGGTELGRRAKAYMDRGELVPDEVTSGMVAERLRRPDCRKGVVLDGFPRTVPQAEALEAILADLGEKLDVVLIVQASEDEVLRRLTGRWSCGRCGAVYHAVFHPAKTEGVCDRCGGPLQQRGDDSPEVQRQRFSVYLEETAPLEAYYRQRGLAVEIDGEQSVEAVARDIQQAVLDHENASG